MIFKKNSWHYWIAEHFGNLDRDNIDFCHYVRQVIKGTALILFFLTAFVWIISSSVVALLTFFSWMFGFSYRGPESLVVVGSTILISLCVSLVLVLIGMHKKQKKETKPGFVRLAYRSFKGKFCPMVEFK